MDKKFLALLSATCIFLGLFIMGMFYIGEREYNKVLNTKVEYLQGEVDHYSDLLDKAEERIEELKEEKDKINEELKDTISDSELHDSYKECLTEVQNEYERKYRNNYIVKQVGITTRADDVIYQFIIVIYDDNFNFIDTWNCYSVYDGDELMYTDCDKVE